MKKTLRNPKLLSAAAFGMLLASCIYFCPVDFSDPAELTVSLEEPALSSQEWLEKEIARKRARREAGYAKADKPNEYNKYFDAVRTPWGEKGTGYGPAYRLKELQKSQRSKFAAQRVQTLDWVERGPGNVPGRTRGLLIDPADASLQTWFAGSVAGGIWKTTDGGNSWVCKTPDLPNLATTSIVMSAANPQVLYAGTGETFSNYNGVAGDGIFKSVDGGETWTQLASTANNNDFRSINRIVVSPDNENILLAATSLSYWGGAGSASKIMKSVDGGQSWRKVYESDFDIQQIVVNPQDFNIQYAAVNRKGVLKSTDGGESWSWSGNLQISGRVELAVAPSDPNWLYASAEGGVSGSGSDLYVSKDAGQNWLLVFQSAKEEQTNYLGGQGWYDNTLAVNPYRTDEVYVAGVNMFRLRLGTEQTLEPDVLYVEEEGTAEFLSFVNFGQPYFGGALAKGASLAGNDFASVEVRFGPGKSQYAHRFTVPEGSGTNADGGAGVPDSEYQYQDFVEVPFEVWDIDNNRQLMISFRDQERDGAFNLNDSQYSDEQLLDNREYVYIHAEDYDPNAPNASIAVQGGQVNRQMYFFWPTLATDLSWDPSALPEATLRIVFGERTISDASMISICDAYGDFGGPNRFAQVTNETTVTGVHPDHHNLMAVPVNPQQQTFKLLVANDGGVFVSNIGTEPGKNDGDWQFAGKGYNTTQFYGIDKKPGTNEYIGGTQDNGTWRSPAGIEASSSTSFQRQIGGDGFEAVWHYEDPNKLLGSVYYNQLYRSSDGGQSWQYISSHPESKEESAPFITKIANHKAQPDVLYTVGASGVWRSGDFGTSWASADMDLSGWLLGSFTDVEISLANPEIIWAGAGMYGNDYAHMYVSTDGGATFSKTPNYTLANLGATTGVYTHPTEDSTAFVLFSFADRPKILKTTDLGQSWTDISGFGTNPDSQTGFPDVAVYSLLVMPHDPQQIWVGTEVGLVESTDGGASWHMANNGLPNVSIWDIKAFDEQVILGTHGRGIWTVDVAGMPGVKLAPQLSIQSINFKRKARVALRLRSEYDSTEVYVDGTLLHSLPAVGIMDTSLQLQLPWELAVTEIRATGYLEGEKYEIGLKKDLSAYPMPVLSYENTLRDNGLDFNGEGFSVRFDENFSFKALHSNHPYAANASYTHSLRLPIIVAEENALLTYEDIALLDPAGDYVLVEASTDGDSWVELSRYDASEEASWQEAFTAGITPNSTHFADRTINLQEYFVASDTIQVRFSLKADGSGNGYGWVIRHLSIQSQEPLAFVDDVQDNKLALEVYPNPVTAETLKLRYHLPVSSEVHLELRDMSGRVLQQLDLGRMPQGTHTFPYSLPVNANKQVLLLQLHTESGSLQSRLLKP